MDDLGTKEQQNDKNGLKRPDKIPFKCMDMHSGLNDLVIKPFIEEEKILPESGITFINFNAHIDDLVPDDMQLRVNFKPDSNRHHLFQDFGTESVIKDLAEEGRLKHVICIKPPWTKGIQDGHKDLIIKTKSNTDTEVTLDIKTLGRSVFEPNSEEDFEGYKSLFTKYLTSEDPYILDFELSFFSADNSFTSDYENCPNFYDKFKAIFKINEPKSLSSEDLQSAVEEHKKKMKDLDEIFQHLHTARTLPSVEGEPSENHKMVSELREELQKFYKDEEIRWNFIYDSGLVCNDYQLPIHYTERKDIERMVCDCLAKILDLLPGPPLTIIISVMYEYLSFTPEKDLDFIIDHLKKVLKNKFNNLDDADFIGY